MNRFDETIDKMQNITNEIKNKAQEKIQGLDEETTLMIQTVAEKTIDVINEAANKLKEAVEKIADEEELNNFLNRVEEKCNNAKDYAYNKFEEIAPSLMPELDEIIEEEEIEEVIYPNSTDYDQEPNLDKKSNYEKIKEFVTKDETKIKVKKAKLLGLKTIDKGLDLILKLYDKK